MIELFSDPQFMVTILVGIAVFATIITVTMPYLEADRLDARIKYVATERATLRAQQRERLGQEKGGGSLREQHGGFIQDIVKHLNLSSLLETGQTRDKLRMAGLRREAHVMTYLFFRATLPFVMFGATFLYINLLGGFGLATPAILLIALVVAYFGFYLPNLFISNLITRRQASIKLAFSDALDLLLICVESGMSIEAAITRVADEIGSQSIPLAEELTLTAAELSYLQERRTAFENLGKRTGLPVVKAVSTSLIQAERYGTPVGTALRVMAQENRDNRMAEAEKKAAGLPPKLTVPMIAFFLPVLFVIILGPAMMQFGESQLF